MVIEFIDANGNIVQVSPDNPLPGPGGSGMSPDDFTATPPLSWDAETETLTIDLSDYAKTADLGTAAAADKAANVATGSTVDDVISALVASGLMASA